MIQLFRNLPIRIKMFSIFVLILLLVSFFNFVYFPWKQKQQVTHALQVRAESSAMMMAAGVTLALEKGDFEFIGELLTFSKGDEGILYIAVCDEEYQPAVSFNPQAVKIPSAAFFAGANTIERDNVLHTTSALNGTGRSMKFVSPGSSSLRQLSCSACCSPSI